MITVLLFAGLQESVGKSQITYPHSSIKVRELLQSLTEQYPTARFQGVMVAVDEQYAYPEDVIVSGNVVALLPPVGGG